MPFLNSVIDITPKRTLSTLAVKFFLLKIDQLLFPTFQSCGFPGGSMVKKLPAIQETQVQSLAQEDPLEKEMAAHSSMLAWETPRTEEPDELQSMGSQRVRHD